MFNIQKPYTHFKIIHYIVVCVGIISVYLYLKINTHKY